MQKQARLPRLPEQLLHSVPPAVQRRRVGSTQMEPIERLMRRPHKAPLTRSVRKMKLRKPEQLVLGIHSQLPAWPYAGRWAALPGPARLPGCSP